MVLRPEGLNLFLVVQKNSRNREWAIAVLGTGAVLVGVLCLDPVLKIQEGCKKKIDVSSEKSSENN